MINLKSDMKKVTRIENDKFALYVGYSQTCLSCEIRMFEVSKVSPLVKELTCYKMDVNEAKDLISDLKICKIPFFILSKDGQVVDVFYTYKSVEDLFIKLVKFVRS